MIDPQARAAIRELSTLFAILAAACLLGIWLADPEIFTKLLANPA